VVQIMPVLDLLARLEVLEIKVVALLVKASFWEDRIKSLLVEMA
jgi:hypothetical protein